MSDIEFRERQLATYRSQGNLQMVAHTLGALGNLYANQGDLSKGIDCLEEAKRINESHGWWDQVANVCYNLAGCYEMGLHDLATALEYMETAARVASPGNPQKETYEGMAQRMREELENR